MVEATVITFGMLLRKTMPSICERLLFGYFRRAIFGLLTLAVVAGNGSFVVAEIGTLPMEHDEYVYMIRFSPDGTKLATAAGDNVARIWNWTTQSILHSLEHEAAVYAAEFSPDGKQLATGSGDGMVALWDVATGTTAIEKRHHADAVYCLVFSSDGTRLASIGGDGRKGDAKCRLWSVPELKVVDVLPAHERPGYGVCFGPAGEATRDMLVTTGGDKLIHVYSLKQNQRTTWTGHTSDVYRCCFSPDGKRLATTSQDGSVRLWDVASGTLVKILIQIKDPTYDVTFSADGRVLAAVGDDGFVRCWDTQTFELLAESKADKEGLYAVAFAPDQAAVVTGGVRGKLHVVPVPRVERSGSVDRNDVEKELDAAGK